MNLIIHDYAGHGFIAELSRGLASQGHQVTHIFGAHNPTPKGYVELLPNDSKGLVFFPITLSAPFQKYSFIKRWQQEREYGRKLAQVVIDIHPDIVISAQTPLDAEVILNRACLSEGIPRVHWLQDLIGVASNIILRNKIPVLGALIGKHYIVKERQLLKSAKAILSISEDFTPLLKEWGISLDKIHVIPNWPTLDHLPVFEKDNYWSRAHDLQDFFVFLYTGTLGFKHNPELLLALAQSVKDDQNVQVVVVSEGPGADWLRQQTLKKNTNNLLILPYQPLNEYAEVLASGDVLVGILEEDAGVYSVPSKVLSYLCAQRPILLSIPIQNMAAQMVSDNNAGLVIAPDHKEDFIKAANQLMEDVSLREKLAINGRKYANEQFNMQRITNIFEHLMTELIEE